MAEEKPSGKASTRAKNKYNAKAYDQFLVTVPAGQKEIINTAANETLQAFNDIKNGNGIHFTGSTDDLFKELAED